ncbi:MULTISPECIES: DUF4236 domain-containing protein [unclassified Veillonella]|uniref:DUF4236 domain-containing protein n=1 Tax=unclassified Veillonella TaxID=2630086 RepID=UPI000F8E2F67|nr:MULTISPECIES: DUF4236 domain-containing protein [unclassified Veillonella]
MGFRFRRTLKIAPGIRLNFGKSGVSASIGPRGAKMTVGKDGVRTTVGLPGSGMSYTHYERYPDGASTTSNSIPFTPTCPRCGHHMRKAWANCPKCSYNLLPTSTPPSNPKPVNSDSTQEPSSTAGCGYLLLIIVVIAFIIYSI